MKERDRARRVDREPPEAMTHRLPDGTRYYGRLGELAYDADEDRVQCHLCGEWFRALGGSHLRRRHGWTLDEYRDAFQLPVGLASCARSVSDRLRASAHRLIERGAFGIAPDEPVRRPARVRPWRSLAVQRPELLGELHPDRNPGLDPAAVAVGSSHRLWWRCPACGHAWRASVGSRSDGHGCPRCYDERRRGQGPRAVSAERSLAALHPELLSEWDRERNSGTDPAAVSPGSKLRVWWRCSACGHAWVASVGNRASGHGCPRCGVRRRAVIRSLVEHSRSLAAQHPELVGELHPIRNPELEAGSVGARSSQKVWWRCRVCGHQWRAAIANRTSGGTGCPVCALERRARTQSQVSPARSLAVKHPQIAAELHPTRNPGLDPARLGARSSLKLWWQCGACGHAWRTAVSTRTDGSGCPACYRARRRNLT